MIELLYIPAMAVLSAWSGGSLWPSQYLPPKLTWLPEAAFAVCIGYALYPIIGLYVLIAIAWSYAWQQSSPAPALFWGDLNHYNPDKKSTLKPLVDFISPWHPSTVAYCRLYIGIKGLLLTLPIGGLGIITHPIGYEIGNRMKNHTVSELLSGAGVGLNIWLFMILFN